MTTVARKTARRVRVVPSAPAPAPKPEWDLRLYVLGENPRSLAAISNLRNLCDAHLSGRYRVEVIDLLQTPRLARDHQIVAIPTLVRELPAPIKRIVGDLSDTALTLVGLDLKPAVPTGSEQT
jgi:circadian clock protein KaiB